MTEDRSPRTTNEPAVGKQRKKRKWDQPAEHLVSTAASMAGVPLNIGALPSVPLPGATMYPAVPALNTVPVPYALPPQLSPLVIQNAVAAVQKLSQAKISDELIAREIVINGAEASIRYKLTKKQTQEEIQKSTGAVIITRGKYQLPNGQPDGEKPLYLHISAGCQLKDTVERIKAVDHAASMVEDILKQGQSPQATSSYSLMQGNGQVHPFSASIYLGFDADPSLNIAARIRGPNDQYINHIMNETGVTVVLRGKDSGNLDTCNAEVSQQLLHLYLSSLHVKNLEAAKVLAENLLDTIAAECGASRISSSKVYSAVPPPQQLLTGVQTSPPASDVPPSTLGSNVPSTSGSTGAPQFFVSNGQPASMGAPSVTPQSRGPTYCGIPPNNTNYPKPPVNGETFYSGYGGIYPQATPLQQVALTLRHAPSLTSPVPSISMSTSTTAKPNSSSDTETDKRSQKRKFQELPVSKGPTIENQNSQQGLEFLKTGQDDLGETSSSSMPPPKKLVWHGSKGMLPPAPRDMPSPPIVSTRMPLPPPRNMPPPPPPPPPKFPLKEMLSRTEIRSSASRDLMAPPRSSDTSSVSLPKFWSAQLPLKEARKGKPSSTPVSDTLLKLMDYGDDEDEDDDHETDNVLRGNSLPSSGHKPFWAESFHNAALL